MHGCEGDKRSDHVTRSIFFYCDSFKNYFTMIISFSSLKNIGVGKPTQECAIAGILLKIMPLFDPQLFNDIP